MGLNPISSKDDAHEIAVDFSKQIINLSSGVLALSATFLPRLSDASALSLVMLLVSWAMLSISVYFGLQTISAIIKSRIDKNQDWATDDGKRFATDSKSLFFLGLVFFLIFAFLILTQQN